MRFHSRPLNVDAVNHAVRSTLISWFDRYADISFQGGAAPAQELEFKLGYVPEGYELIEIQENTIRTTYIYKKNNSGLYFDYLPFTYRNSFKVDNENLTVLRILEGKNQYYLFERTQGYPNTVFWVEEGYSLPLNADLPLEELINIADGIKKHVVKNN